MERSLILRLRGFLCGASQGQYAIRPTHQPLACEMPVKHIENISPDAADTSRRYSGESFYSLSIQNELPLSGPLD